MTSGPAKKPAPVAFTGQRIYPRCGVGGHVSRRWKLGLSLLSCGRYYCSDCARPFSGMTLLALRIGVAL